MNVALDVISVFSWAPLWITLVYAHEFHFEYQWWFLMDVLGELSLMSLRMSQVIFYWHPSDSANNHCHSSDCGCLWTRWPSEDLWTAATETLIYSASRGCVLAVQACFWREHVTLEGVPFHMDECAKPPGGMSVLTLMVLVANFANTK